MTDLARAFPVDASVMSRQVSKLVDRGLMSRKRRSHILHRACPASQAGRCAGPFHFPLAIDSHVRPRIKGVAGSELVEGPSDHGSTGSPRTGAPRNHSCEGRNPSMGRGERPIPPLGARVRGQDDTPSVIPAEAGIHPHPPCPARMVRQAHHERARRHVVMPAKLVLVETGRGHPEGGGASTAPALDSCLRRNDDGWLPRPHGSTSSPRTGMTTGANSTQ